MSKTNGFEVVAPAALVSVFSLPAVQVPAPAAMRQKCTLAVVAVGFSSPAPPAEPSARARTSGRPPAVASREIGPSTAAAVAGAHSAARASAAKHFIADTMAGRLGRVPPPLRLEPLAEQHLPAVDTMLTDPEIRRFTR